MYSSKVRQLFAGMLSLFAVVLNQLMLDHSGVRDLVSALDLSASVARRGVVAIDGQLGVMSRLTADFAFAGR